MRWFLVGLLLCQGGFNAFVRILQRGLGSLACKACLHLWPPVGADELYMEWILSCITHQLVCGLSFVQINTSAIYLEQ